MKIYTKTGDSGTTSLFGGTRVPKHHIRIQSYGTVDELNAWVGMLHDQMEDTGLQELLRRIQDRLFTMGAQLASEPESETGKGAAGRKQIPQIREGDIRVLETAMDEINDSLPEMRHFILPGGHPTVSSCHIARTVCRRAERMTTLLAENSPVPPEILKYLNRLSDYFFVLARKLSSDLGAIERKWVPQEKSE